MRLTVLLIALRRVQMLYQTGHLAKDCPRRHRLSPQNSSRISTLQSNTVGVTAADIQAAALSEGTVQGLYGFAIGLVTEGNPMPELEVAKHLVVKERALSLLRMAAPLPTDEMYDTLYDPMSPD
ncbi:hypothetical protein F4604DRAFT_1678216 [Suillus subluteus]|nr:hypothetical protein F4604DRAFT_1678216 [Suillus subluteus]